MFGTDALKEVCIASKSFDQFEATGEPDEAGIRMGKRRGKGEGAVFQCQDGRWEASFYLENGKRKSFYGRTQMEALQKLRAAQLEEKQGMLTTGSKQALKYYLEHWNLAIQQFRDSPLNK